ncbi:MAG: hypothetical protein US31_C0011G0035 [Berkelbacteria bacterium GW2011_GWA1_36_9]|uniref:Histidine-specific methyltransferase SAM-dependent domain-containing protein n=1 Tax=Berkelbacteria bacterium GW2011_GWA1_36_9 TaxID=1618331 RepID=A0A0G0FG15_9BACT|nr:MAG: hypothetical protein US31_C0011G0035 [Berkelbacteria bacterium GW2011_GWA1_36_9]
MYTQSQISELITAIKGRGEIPLKFDYIGELGAKRWAAIASKRHSDKHGINKVESDLLNAKVDAFIGSFKTLKKLNIIDIGPGDGSAVLPLLYSLKEKSVDFRYVPVDISQEMLDSSTKNIKNLFQDIAIEPVQLDFELGNFAEVTYRLKQGGYQNLMLFLGSTLGNQSDRQRVLTNFRDSMTSEDFLIIGVELVNLNKIEKIIEQYHVKEAEDLSMTTAENIGIKRSDGKYEVRFNNESSQVEGYFTFQANTSVEYANEKIIFEENDKLLLFRSLKFTEWIFAKVLSEVGFRMEIFTTSSEKGYSLVMCQPQRFNY